MITEAYGRTWVEYTKYWVGGDVEKELQKHHFYGKIVCDLGCGDGRLLQYLIQANKIYCIDKSKELLNIASQKYSSKKTIFCETDIISLPLESSSIDFAICAWTLQETKDPIKALQEMLRILKPNGELILIDPIFEGSDWLKIRSRLEKSEESKNELNKYWAKVIDFLQKKMDIKVKDVVEYYIFPDIDVPVRIFKNIFNLEDEDRLRKEFEDLYHDNNPILFKDAGKMIHAIKR